MSNRVLFAADVAELLSCTESQVEDLWRGKKLPGMKAGRSWLVTEAALYEALDELCGLNFIRASDPGKKSEKPLAVQVPEEQRAAANNRRFNSEPPPLPELPQSSRPAKSSPRSDA